MSTKTLRKRIALATVAALGAGVLSLVSTTSANAASTQGSTSTNATAAYGNLNIATVASTTGAAVAADSTSANGRSVGLLAWGDIAGGTTAGTTQTATMLSTGTLVVYTTPSTGHSAYISTTGLIQSTGTSAGSVSSDLKMAATEGASGTQTILSVAIKPASGQTSFTVSMYTDSAADTASAILGGTATGTMTLSGYITVTVASTSVAGVVSAAKSGIWYTGQKSPGGATITTALTSDSTTLATPGSISGISGYADVRVRDAYGSAVTGAGLLQATATNGALISFSGSAGTATAATNGATASSTAYVSVAAGASADDYTITVDQPTSAPLSTVVTVSWNGTVVGTKSFTFTGQIAKITLSGAANGKTSNSTGNTATIAFADAAGNTVYPTASYFAGDAATYGGIVSAITMSTTPSSSAVGKITYTCGTVAGSANIGVTYTNTDGTVISSNKLKVTCSGAPVNYTAKYDKSTYKPGEIATLTVTFKDSKGNVANDVDTLTASGAYHAITTYLPTVGTAGVTALTGPSTTDASTNGVVTYTYSVGTTTGTFTNPVTFSYIDSQAVASGLTASGPVPVTLTIADGATSLNDVLKGIVSLIASINKQIAALAKLVTKKK